MNPRPKRKLKDFYKLTPMSSGNYLVFSFSPKHNQPTGQSRVRFSILSEHPEPKTFAASRQVYAREVRSRNVSSKTVA